MVMAASRESFQGGVFHASIPGGRSGATLSIARGELIADTISEPSMRFSIPLNQCQIDLGGASNRMVFCRTKEGDLTIFCEEKNFAKELDFQSGGMLAGPLKQLKKGLAADANRFRFWLTLSAVACALLLFVGYFAVLWTAKIAMLEITVNKQGKVVSAQSSIAIQGRSVTSDVIRGGTEAGQKLAGTDRAVQIGTDLIADVSAKMLREKIVEAWRVSFPSALRHNYNLLYQAIKTEEEPQSPAAVEPAKVEEKPVAPKAEVLEIKLYGTESKPVLPVQGAE
jgi:hypothetical protein